jgi:hypothetical protein
MAHGFDIVASRAPAEALREDAPTHERMAPVGVDRRAPTTDQKKVRRQQAKTASYIDPNSFFVLVGGQVKDGPFISRPAAEASPAAASADAVVVPGYEIEEMLSQYRASKTTKESSMNFADREADILRALGRATPTEQARLVAELDQVRAERRRIAAEDRELDLGSAYIRDVLTPVATHQHHTSATDWIADVAPDEEAVLDASGEAAVRAEATLWFKRTSAEVRADREEFAEQAHGMARRTSSLMGDLTGRAAQVFLDHVAHLHRTADGVANEPVEPIAPAADAPTPENWPIDSAEGGQETTGDSQDLGEIPQVTSALSDDTLWAHLASPQPGDANSQGVSSLPVEVPLKGHEQVFDNFKPPVAPINQGVAYNEPTSEDAPVVKENQQDAPEHSSGGGNAGQIADPSGQAQSKLPEPNDNRPAFSSLDQRFAGLLTVAGIRSFVCEGCGAEWDDDSGLASWKSWGCDKCGSHDIRLWSADDEAKAKEKAASRKVAYDPIADPSGQAVSQLPVPDDPKDEDVMWPWELNDSGQNPVKGAADVASVPNPATGYPQPTAAKTASVEWTEGTAPSGATYFKATKDGYDLDIRPLREGEGTVGNWTWSVTGDGANGPRNKHGQATNRADAERIALGIVEDQHGFTLESSRKVAEGGQTCAQCGASIERDPAGEEPRTWHHNDGASHDHEAKPSGGEKESARKLAGETATCAHCGKQIEDDDGTWYHVESMQARCDGPDDEEGIGWGDLVRQAEPKTARRVVAYTYCPEHGVAVGDGNRDTHAGCKTEQREKVESARRHAAIDVTGWTEEMKLAALEGLAKVDDAWRRHQAGGLDNLGDSKAEPFGSKDDDEDDEESKTAEARLGRPVPFTPTQAAFRQRVQAAISNRA